MGTAANIAIIVCEILGLSKIWKARSWKLFVFYTLLSNFLAMISSVVFLLAGNSGISAILRYLATCMLVMTFLVTACILSPALKGFKKLMLEESGLYHHTLVPILSLVSYACWEPHTHIWLLPALTTLAYGVIMLILNGLGKVDGPYPFFRVRNQSVAATIGWMILLFGMIAGISLLVAWIT